jgi:hypothetical protein
VRRWLDDAALARAPVVDLAASRADALAAWRAMRSR